MKLPIFAPLLLLLSACGQNDEEAELEKLRQEVAELREQVEIVDETVESEIESNFASSESEAEGQVSKEQDLQTPPYVPILGRTKDSINDLNQSLELDEMRREVDQIKRDAFMRANMERMERAAEAKKAQQRDLNRQLGLEW